MAGVDGRRAFAEAVERLAGPGVREAEHRRSRAGGGLDRQQPTAVAGGGGAEGARGGLRLLRAALRERCVEQGHDGDVQSVEPHDGPVRLVAVVVPGARGGDDEIPFVHDGLLTVHRGIGPLPLHHEAKGGLAMAVGRGHLSGQDELEPRVERGRDPGLAPQARVLEDQHPPLRLPGGDEAARLEEQGAHVLVAPAGGPAAARGGGGDEVAQHLPQRRHRERVEPSVVVVAPRRRRTGHRIASVQGLVSRGGGGTRPGSARREAGHPHRASPRFELRVLPRPSPPPPDRGDGTR